eukprot:GHVT01080809.1.p1 GENE.GHVT01080809.1~~GHVT01080809.1.p1  ORF type:complete len:900 (+),score=81.76 GHVT01080809.1:2401-5100(+)
MFEESLATLVKCLRQQGSGRDIEEFISERVCEIKKELTSMDASVKSTALQKLWYLQMWGCDISWAQFSVVDVMSLCRFSQKHPGFSLCGSTFTDCTESAVLTTNILKKNLGSKDMYSVGLALSCLASMASPDLARDLHHDIITLLSSSRPYIRRRAALVLYRIYTKYPPALVESFDRLRARLQDPQEAVVVSTITCLAELVRHQPADYLGVVPELYHIFRNVTNNWLTIKLLKMFSALCPLEPRLPKKLEPHLLILFAKATKEEIISVEYEIIKLVVQVFSPETELVQRAFNRLQVFLEWPDANVRFMGLTAVAECVQVVGIREAMLQALPDLHTKVLVSVENNDPTVRSIALSILHELCDEAYFKDVTERLVGYSRAPSQDPAAREEFLATLLSLGAKASFSQVDDLDRYLLVLADVATLCPPSSQIAICVAEQLVEIATRFENTRPFAVQVCCLLVEPGNNSSSAKTPKYEKDDCSTSPTNSELAAESSAPNGSHIIVPPAVIMAAAQIIGEFAECIVTSLGPASFDVLPGAFNCLLQQSERESNPPDVRRGCLLSALRLFVLFSSELSSQTKSVGNEFAVQALQCQAKLTKTLPELALHPCFEIADAAIFATCLVNYAVRSPRLEGCSGLYSKDIMGSHFFAEGRKHGELEIKDHAPGNLVNFDFDTPFYGVKDSFDNIPVGKELRLGGVIVLTDAMRKQLEKRLWSELCSNDDLQAFSNIDAVRFPSVNANNLLQVQVDLRIRNCKPDAAILKSVSILFSTVPDGVPTSPIPLAAEVVQRSRRLTVETYCQGPFTACDTLEQCAARSLPGKLLYKIERKQPQGSAAEEIDGTPLRSGEVPFSIDVPATYFLKPLLVSEEQLAATMKVKTRNNRKTRPFVPHTFVRLQEAKVKSHL